MSTSGRHGAIGAISDKIREMGHHGQIIFLLLVLVAFFAFSGFVLKDAPKRSDVPPVNTSSREKVVFPEKESSSGDKTVSVPEEEKTETPQVAPSERDGSVQIYGVTRSSANRPVKIVLKANLQEGEEVDIDNWEIRGNDGSVFIPQAVKYYRIPGTNEEGDIVLEAGHSVTMYLGMLSPISKNLQLNKCTGYLNQKYDFKYYPLPEECPLPDKDDYKYLSGECQDYIKRIGRCEIPPSEETNAFFGESGNRCREFINGFFNTTNCYNSFREDEDFLKGEWRVWLPYKSAFDSDHDWLKLLNTEGKVIDEYTY